MRTVLVTNVKHYTAPGTIPVLLREKMRPVCHDSSFEGENSALSFEKSNAGATALRAQTPESLFAEMEDREIVPDAVISNDVFPNTPCLIEHVPVATLRESFEALLLFPFKLTTGARVAAMAGRGDVFATNTVKDLVAGSGLQVESRGIQPLKGVPGEWHIFSVTT